MSPRDKLAQQATRLANELAKVRREAKKAPPANFHQYYARVAAIRAQMRDVLDQHARTPE